MRTFWLHIFFLCGISVAFAQHPVAVLHAGAESSILVSSTPSVNASSHTIPFELINGMIVVEAALNERVGKFILDTGAPGIVLHSRQLPTKVATAVGIGGTCAYSPVHIRNFSWLNHHWENVEGVALDLSHLERAVGQRLRGLIGYEFLSQHTVFIDYDQRRITIWSSESGPEDFPYRVRQRIPFHLVDHLPILHLKANGKRLRLALDSGSETNLLADAAFARVTDRRSITGTPHEVQGLDQQILTTRMVRLSNLRHRRNALPDLDFLLLDFAPLRAQTGLVLDGLLGFSFLQQFPYSIDYQRGELIIYDPFHYR